MSITPLSTLLTCGRADGHPVATRHGETLTFAQFKADVGGMAAALGTPARVAITCSDSYRFVAALFGVLHAGGTAVLPATAHLVNTAAHDIAIDDAAFERLRTTPPAALAPLDATRPDICFYTSGSTGAPKCIRKALQMLEAELAVLDARWGGAHAQVLATVPHHHLYGLTFSVLWPLASGRRFESGMHHFWESLMAQCTADTIVISSPAHLERLGGIAPLPPAQQPARVFSAGAPLPYAASQQAQATLGCLPTEIFGSTETGAIATRQQHHADAPWQPLPGIHMACDEQQRLVLTSPFIGPTPLTTDDMLEHVKGGFRFLGRFDRMVKISGKRVHLSHVEQCLLQHPFVAQAATTTLLRDNRLELVAAVVLSDAGREALHASTPFTFRQQLRRAMAAHCEPAAIPRRWRFVEALPQHPLGKRRDHDIIALFSEAV